MSNIDSGVQIVLIIIGAFLLWLFITLIRRRWFWILIFSVSTLASIFSVLASIISFQILLALAFTFTGMVCYLITIALVEWNA
jgi:hypothetical protein